MQFHRITALLAPLATACAAPHDDDHDPGDVTVVHIVAEGFSLPESAHFHTASETWFVSSIAGETGVADGVGWVSRLDRSGAFIEEKWLDGLDAPTGITSDEDKLYVVDIGRVHVIDIETAQEVETIAFEGAQFLNDPVLAPDGSLFVSDSFGQAIYRSRAGEEVELVVQDDALNFPNGLGWHDGRLLVASIGPFMDFEAEGPVQWLDVDSGMLETWPGLSGKFDGVEVDGETVWLTDFRGQLIRIDGDDEVVTRDLTLDGLMGTADLGYDAELGVVAIPDLFGDQVAFIEMRD